MDPSSLLHLPPPTTPLLMPPSQFEVRPPRPSRPRPEQRQPPVTVSHGIILITKSAHAHFYPKFMQYTFNPSIIKEWIEDDGVPAYTNQLYVKNQTATLSTRTMTDVLSVNIQSNLEKEPIVDDRGRAQLTWKDTRADITVSASTILWE